jgi:hypothetical protein
MPNYNPKDMAMVLRMSKTGSAMTPQELALMQNINQAMLPEVAAGNVGIMPAMQNGMPVANQFGAAMTQAEMNQLMKTRGR